MLTALATILLSPFQAGIDLPPGPGPLDNPLKGYASYSGQGESHHTPVSMAYADASWRELEPTEGDYMFEEWEHREWDTPLAKGKRMVLRVWMDYPNQPTGVPQWLIDKGVSMRKYTDFGGGLSPDYEDARLQSALLRLIDRLGKRYDGNERVAFVQVGLLGHWGEFHTYPRDELFASVATQRKVVDALHRAFPHKHLMGRNPSYPSLQLPWIGFHDDMIPEDTLPPDDWKFIPAMIQGKVSDNWKVAPTGGEMVPGAAAKWLGPGWEDTKRAVRDAHFSWIGPYCPAMVSPPNEAFREHAEELIRMLGYEFRLTRLTTPTTTPAKGALPVRVEGINQGVAPFYYSWPVEVVLLDGKDRVASRQRVAADIRRWLPGNFRFTASVPARVPVGTYRLAVGILDPWTARPGVRFANRLAVVGGYTVLRNILVKPLTN